MISYDNMIHESPFLNLLIKNLEIIPLSSNKKTIFLTGPSQSHVSSAKKYS